MPGLERIPELASWYAGPYLYGKVGHIEEEVEEDDGLNGPICFCSHARDEEAEVEEEDGQLGEEDCRDIGYLDAVCYLLGQVQLKVLPKSSTINLCPCY